MAVSMIGPKFYAFGRDGKPLAFGRIYTYLARTNTPKPTYQSEDQQVENANPVILNGEGYANIFLYGSYKIVLKDQDDNEIWTADPVSEASTGNSLTYVLTAYYLTSSSFKVLGDHSDAMPAGARVEIGFLTSTSQQSTILTSTFDGTYTNINIEDSVITTDINTASLPTGMSAIADFNDISQEQLESQEQAFQDRFALSQSALPWAPLTPIEDDLQLYSTGTIGESGYSVWLADPLLLPFTTGSSFAEDQLLGRWAEATVATRDYALKTAIARSLNVSNSSVIYSSDTTTVLDSVLYVYDDDNQRAWAIPTLAGTGETIVSVVDETLTTSAGAYELRSTGHYDQTTLEEAEKLSPSVGARVIIREYAEANFIVQPAGYVIQPGDITFANGLAGELLITGKANAKWFGAKGDGTTNDKNALQNWLDRAKALYLPEGTYITDGAISKTGQFWSIDGDGKQLSIILSSSVTDILVFDNSGASIARASIDGVGVFSSLGNKSAGTSIRFVDKALACTINNVYMRNFFDGIVFDKGSTTFKITNFDYDQFGRTTGTKGRYAISCSSLTESMTDFHMTNIQGSGFEIGGGHLLQAHLYVRLFDGIYISNSHMFYGDRTIYIAPVDGEISASLHIDNSYLDTIRLNHVYVADSTGATLISYNLSNCQLRQAEEGDSILLLNSTDVLNGFRVTGGSIRSNFGSGIKAAESNTLLGLNVTGVGFDTNNTDNQTVAGDIVTRGVGGSITGNVFKGGGANGKCVYLLSTSEDNIVGLNNYTKSTCTVKELDSGTGNLLSASLGA